MKKIYAIFLTATVLFINGCQGNMVDVESKESQGYTLEEETDGRIETSRVSVSEKEADVPIEEPGIYALLQVSAGGESLEDIIIKLFPEEAPNTVANFKGLATGRKEYRDPQTGQWVREKFYDGLAFHRIIPDFMIQGGDPLGTGKGGPGYQFDCEISPELSFDRPGRLAMANAGPDTNGSQFFITVAPTPWLDGNHTIFGQVVEGMDTVVKISQMPTGSGDRPVEPVIMERVQIIEK